MDCTTPISCTSIMKIPVTVSPSMMYICKEKISWSNQSQYNISQFSLFAAFTLIRLRGGRVVRWCWVNFQCRGILSIWIVVGQGFWRGLFEHFFSHLSFLSFSPAHWEIARYRLKYCIKGPYIKNKQTTNYQVDCLFLLLLLFFFFFFEMISMS